MQERVLAQDEDPEPGLSLVIIVDQMRYDYLTRYRDLYSDSGFVLLMKMGAVMTNCNFPHVPTATGPGHASLLSGTSPGRSGIVANTWFDPATGKNVYCVSDTTSRSVGIEAEDPAGMMSPRNFNSETVGDEIFKSADGSKTIGIALKDRAAILPTGIRATAAYWFDAKSGKWITSTYYMPALPAWVQRFNARKFPESYLGKSWTKLLPDSAYARSGIDDAPGEGTLEGESKPVFPHMVKNMTASEAAKDPKARRFEPVLYTPYGNDLEFAFAESTVINERLGSRGGKDLLSLSLSAPDYCGHTFGPESYEQEDMYVRLDRQLKDFLKFMNKYVGLKYMAVVLTADHGVAPLPEQHTAQGGMRIDPSKFVANVRKGTGAAFQYDEEKEHLIRTFSNEYFYLDEKKIAGKGFDLSAFEDTVRNLSLAQEGIGAAFTRGDLRDLARHPIAGDSIGFRVVNGYNAQLCGQVTVIQKPYVLWDDGNTGTEHGTPYSYDTHVPFIFIAPSVKPGTYDFPCTPYDISTTLAHAIKVWAPKKSAGNILWQILYY